jgi:transposase
VNNIWHPDYGVPTPHRMKVLREADRSGILKAAEMYNVGVSTLYRWRKKVETGE